MRKVFRVIGTIIRSILTIAIGAGVGVMYMRYTANRKEALEASTFTESTPAPTPKTSILENLPPVTTAGPKSFEIQAGNHSYSIREMRVKVGDTVTVRMKNLQGFHDFTIDAFKVKTETLSPGNEETVTFVADTAGTFQYYCRTNNYGTTEGMTGMLIVEE